MNCVLMSIGAANVSVLIETKFLFSENLFVIAAVCFQKVLFLLSIYSIIQCLRLDCCYACL